MTSEEDNDDGIFESSMSEDPRYSAVLEDDGEVAYGYLLLDGEIVSHVWLYNNDDAAARFIPIVDGDDVSFVWAYGESGVPVSVEFWIRGRLHARVAPNSNPGWCVLALEDGPLARKLE